MRTPLLGATMTDETARAHTEFVERQVFYSTFVFVLPSFVHHLNVFDSALPFGCVTEEPKVVD